MLRISINVHICWCKHVSQTVHPNARPSSLQLSRSPAYTSSNSNKCPGRGGGDILLEFWTWVIFVRSRNDFFIIILHDAKYGKLCFDEPDTKLRSHFLNFTTILHILALSLCKQRVNQFKHMTVICAPSPASILNRVRDQVLGWSQEKWLGI